MTRLLILTLLCGTAMGQSLQQRCTPPNHVKGKTCYTPSGKPAWAARGVGETISSGAAMGQVNDIYVNGGKYGLYGTKEKVCLGDKDIACFRRDWDVCGIRVDVLTKKIRGQECLEDSREIQRKWEAGPAIMEFRKHEVPEYSQEFETSDDDLMVSHIDIGPAVVDNMPTSSTTCLTEECRKKEK